MSKQGPSYHVSMTTSLYDTLLWADAAGMPGVLDSVMVSFAERQAGAIALLADARRIVATGNGAAYYAGLSLEAAARLHPVRGVTVDAIPAGLLTSEDFTWQTGDVPLVFSSSGELRDVVDLVNAGRFPSNWVAVTANPGSTLGLAASEIVSVSVTSQKSMTHTQGYVANALAGLLLWQNVAGEDLGLELDSLVGCVEDALASAGGWANTVAPAILESTGGIAFASGAGWSAALETALLFKEVTGLPMEGLESREAATSGMYALRPGSVVISMIHEGDVVGEETEALCAETGATVVRLKIPNAASSLLTPIVGFSHAVALSGTLGLLRGINIDEPEWATAYLRTTRSISAEAGEQKTDGYAGPAPQ